MLLSTYSLYCTFLLYFFTSTSYYRLLLSYWIYLPWLLTLLVLLTFFHTYSTWLTNWLLTTLRSSTTTTHYYFLQLTPTPITLLGLCRISQTKTRRHAYYNIRPRMTAKILRRYCTLLHNPIHLTNLNTPFSRESLTYLALSTFFLQTWKQSK